MPKAGNFVRINIYLPPQQHKALQVLSKKTGLSYAELVRRAVSDYLPGAIEQAKKS